MTTREIAEQKHVDHPQLEERSWLPMAQEAAGEEARSAWIHGFMKDKLPATKPSQACAPVCACHEDLPFGQAALAPSSTISAGTSLELPSGQ